MNALSENGAFKKPYIYNDDRVGSRNEGKNMLDIIFEVAMFGFSGFIGLFSIIGSVFDSIPLAVVFGVVGFVLGAVMFIVATKKSRRISP